MAYRLVTFEYSIPPATVAQEIQKGFPGFKIRNVDRNTGRITGTFKKNAFLVPLEVAFLIGASDVGTSLQIEIGIQTLLSEMDESRVDGALRDIYAALDGNHILYSYKIKNSGW